jgi:hypothetical protein
MQPSDLTSDQQFALFLQQELQDIKYLIEKSKEGASGQNPPNNAQIRHRVTPERRDVIRSIGESLQSKRNRYLKMLHNTEAKLTPKQRLDVYALMKTAAFVAPTQ